MEYDIEGRPIKPAAPSLETVLAEGQKRFRRLEAPKRRRPAVLTFIFGFAVGVACILEPAYQMGRSAGHHQINASAPAQPANVFTVGAALMQTPGHYAFCVAAVDGGGVWYWQMRADHTCLMADLPKGTRWEGSGVRFQQ